MSNEADTLLREAFGALQAYDGARERELRAKIERYLDGQPTRFVDTSSVAQDLLSVNSGAGGFNIDRAMQRVKDIGKAPKS